MNEFTTMQIINGDRSTMQLKNIPASMNGWKVYCAYSNNIGTSNTKTALLTVTNQVNPTPTVTPGQDQSYSAIYNGTYVESIAGKGTITISGGPDVFYVSVHWPSSYDEFSDWSFSGSFDGRGVLNYNNCVRTTTKFADAESSTTVTNYTGGTGYLQMADTGLTWVDNVDNAGNMSFFLKQ